jgi:hypothetical protein
VQGGIARKGGRVVIILESAMMCGVLFQGREDTL